MTWRLEVPAGTHPDRDLRAWLETVDAPGPRRRGIAALDRLEEGRQQRWRPDAAWTRWPAP